MTTVVQTNVCRIDARFIPRAKIVQRRTLYVNVNSQPKDAPQIRIQLRKK